MLHVFSLHSWSHDYPFSKKSSVQLRNRLSVSNFKNNQKAFYETEAGKKILNINKAYGGKGAGAYGQEGAGMLNWNKVLNPQHQEHFKNIGYKKAEVASLQKEYERMLGIPGVGMYKASDENSKMAADFYSNAVLSKQLMEAFQRAGYDSIEFNVAREPDNPQERATKITETIEKETVPLVPSAEQKSMFNRTQEIEELKKAAEEQNRELDKELIDLQIKGLFPEDYMETDVPTKVMSFKGANTPLLSRELKDSSTRYFLLDDTQFLEKNKYTNFSYERLK